MSRETRRPPLALARVRLVGFHNFVDETIELSAAGGSSDTGTVRTHLFLLGDNGSGKSTVLDAIHLVLTGADVELNAAARVGARARALPGRTLAGIVLRQRDDRVREGHAIAYAALELASPSERWTIGVGLGATTLDAHVTRWGFVHAGPLSSVELLRESGGARRPLTPDELAASLGRGAVHGRIGDYRARIAELFFGGEVGYERACRLWGMAKAYRELAASTREPSEIVSRFLPAPASEAIASIRTAVSHLDELELDARALEAQRARIAGIVACRDELLRARNEGRSLEARIARARVAQLESELASVVQRRGALRDELREASDRCARAGEQEQHALAMLAAAQSGEVGTWMAAREAARTVHAARQADLERAEAARVEARRREELDRRALAEAEQALVTAEARARDALLRAVTEASRLPFLLPLAAGVAHGRGEVEGAQRELTAALEEARATHTEAVARLRDAERALGRAMDAAHESSASGPSALDALRDVGLEAVALSRALEIRASAEPSHVAALEAVVPRQVWATLVTKEEDVALAQAALGGHAGARLAIAVDHAAALPPWVDALLEPPCNALETRARAVLARELDAASGALAPPDALGGAVLRGVYVRASAHATTLGAHARARARALELAAREAASIAAGAARDRAAEAALQASEQIVRLEQALAALASLRSAELGALRASRDHARTALENALPAVDRAERAFEDARMAAASAERALGSSVPPSDEAAAAWARCSERERELREAREAHASALEARAACASREAELERRETQLGAESARLRALLPADAALGEGDATAEELQRDREQLAREERARLDELLGDGSRGIGGVPGSAFALLGDDEEGPRLEDASGRSPAGVLAELDRKLAEIASALSQRARDVFDGVVMGSLAGQLQREVEQLHATFAGINEHLGRASYGGVRYAFRVTPRADRAELVSLVRRMSVLDPASRSELRRYVEERRADLAAPGDEPPALLDYRRWFDVRLVTRKQSGGESLWSRERAATGSGGEQGVPSHLVVLALARLTFDGARARVTPLLLDEAFHGIDATRREALLGAASELGLQLVVASPEQDGVVRGVRSTTTLFVVKDERDDVQLVPYHYYDHAAGPQTSLAV
ncbi:MAG: SbcC/MukB-like Walker B domain-containing protein [Sandaracinus sp.]